MNDTFYSTIKAGLTNKVIPTVESGQGAYLTINNKQKLNLCSNNYLGFAADERLRAAAIQAIQMYGVGTGSVRALSGTNTLHIQLEEALARFKHAEACIVLTGGYLANMAAIQTIIGKEDIIVSDELNHASIIDAIRLSGVKNKFIYKHADIEDLEGKLQEATRLAASRGTTKPTMLIITDGVFSMDGDLAPLPEIVALAEKYNAITMVDDAHGEGVLGNHGRGIVDHFNLHGKVDIEVGTLSKAFGVMGGFITGKNDLISFYRQKARQFLFSNGLSIPDTAALLEAVQILEETNEPLKKLWENAQYLKNELIALGFDCGDSKTPITPVMLGDEEIAKLFSAKLLEHDVFATPILFPMVARGKARIRVMPSAAHTKEDLDKGITAFKFVGNELNIM